MREQEGWQVFLELCSKAHSAKMLDGLLTFFFTDEERDQMAKRILLVQALLTADKSQREIAKELQISISKITRGSNLLKQVDPQLKLLLNKNLVTQ